VPMKSYAGFRGAMLSLSARVALTSDISQITIKSEPIVGQPRF